MPVRHVGRPDAPAAQSPSQEQLEPSGRLPERTQKPFSEPPPHVSAAEHTRQSSFETPPLREQRVGLTSTHVPSRQHWPTPQLAHRGGVTQRNLSHRASPEQVAQKFPPLPQFEFVLPTTQFPNWSQHPEQLTALQVL